MHAISLPFETWLAIIDVLRAHDLPYMVEHADLIEAKLDQHAADETMVSLGLTEDV
jgi:hypothetical protein